MSSSSLLIQKRWGCQLHSFTLPPLKLLACHSLLSKRRHSAIKEVQGKTLTQRSGHWSFILFRDTRVSRWLSSTACPPHSSNSCFMASELHPETFGSYRSQCGQRHDQHSDQLAHGLSCRSTRGKSPSYGTPDT